MGSSPTARTKYQIKVINRNSGALRRIGFTGPSPDRFCLNATRYKTIIYLYSRDAGQGYTSAPLIVIEMTPQHFEGPSVAMGRRGHPSSIAKGPGENFSKVAEQVRESAALVNDQTPRTESWRRYSAAVSMERFALSDTGTAGREASASAGGPFRRDDVGPRLDEITGGHY